MEWEIAHKLPKPNASKMYLDRTEQEGQRERELKSSWKRAGNYNRFWTTTIKKMEIENILHQISAFESWKKTEIYPGFGTRYKNLQKQNK